MPMIHYVILNNDFLNLLKVASEFLSDLSCKSGFQVCTYFGTKFKQESNNSNVRNEKKYNCNPSQVQFFAFFLEQLQ